MKLLLVASFFHDAFGTVVLPPWPPTYNMSLSTIMMPCNDSGYMDAGAAGAWGIVDYDWSNAKKQWANAKPMDCGPEIRHFVAHLVGQRYRWGLTQIEQCNEPIPLRILLYTLGD